VIEKRSASALKKNSSININAVVATPTQKKKSIAVLRENNGSTATSTLRNFLENPAKQKKFTSKWGSVRNNLDKSIFKTVAIAHEMAQEANYTPG
jgi:hypothetical protein